eukprot:5183675-Pyramimonas_sp.AAC.1
MNTPPAASLEGSHQPPRRRFRAHSRQRPGLAHAGSSRSLGIFSQNGALHRRLEAHASDPCAGFSEANDRWIHR